MAISKIKLFLAALLVCLIACYYWLQPPRAAQETLFWNGTILTVEAGTESAEALLIRDDRIAALGSYESVKAAAQGSPDIIDLQGKTLMPGLIEPHTHPLTTALYSATIDLSGFKHGNRAEVIETLKAGIEKGSNNGWFVATGWDPVMLADLFAPTIEELDALSPDTPLILLTQMMHDAYANSLALEKAGITATSTAPKGGEFVKDEEGKLTGTIREISAIGELFKALPTPPAGAHSFLLAQQYKKYAKAGYTTLGIPGPVARADDPISILKKVAGLESAPVRTLIYGLPDQMTDFASPEDDAHTAPVIGVKFWMDGSPFAGGAAFQEPYQNSDLVKERLHLDHNHMGALNYDPETFSKLFEDYHQRGFQIAVHTQGERAIDRALDIVENTLTKHPRTDHRHRLEHNALITKAQLERAQELGMSVSFFTNHLYYYGHALPDLVGERTQRYMPVKTALNAGHKVTIHTDNPASPVNAFQAMQTLRMRTARTGGETLGPDQKLSPYEALKAMTLNSAWQLGIEKETGSLKAGKSADFVILSANPLQTADADLTDIQVYATWLKGQRADTRTVNADTISLGLDIAWSLVSGRK